MPLYSWLLSAWLIGQTGGGPTAPVIVNPPTTLPARTMPGSVQVQPATTQPEKSRATADQLVTEALALPPSESIAGQPMSLATVLASLPDRQRQTEAVHAYWRLVQATGDCHYCTERQQRLARLTAAKDEAGDLRTAQASAMARLREAEIQAVSAQHDLAGLLHLTETAPLPLPADRPLTEPYRTRFTELFAGQKAPDRMRMLDQTLGLRQRAVEAHAAALLAAEESLDAAIELHFGGQGRLSSVLQAMDAEIRQQQAFLASVCRYNHDIADYALSVVPSQTAPELLAATMIKPLQPSKGANVPAGYEQPLAAPSQPAVARPNWPTRAAPPALVVPPSGGAPLSVRPKAELQAPAAAAGAPALVAPPDSPPDNDAQEPHLAPPQESAIPLVPPKPADTRPPANDGKSSGSGTIRSTLKPVVENAVQLAASLYEDQGFPLPSGLPMGLADCLRSTAPGRRGEMIESYWTAGQVAAYCQLLAEEEQWLDGLKPALAAQNPLSPTGILELRSARLAVEARLVEAQADCLAADFQLAIATGMSTEKVLPRPTSVPFSGHFALPPSLRERAKADSWAARRTEAEIPRREQAINDQATTVFEADAARAAATADFFAGRTTAEHVLATIDVQADETTAFLRVITAYNRVIAQYVTLRLGETAPTENVVAALLATP